MRTFDRIFGVVLCVASIGLAEIALTPDAVAAEKLFFEGDMVRGRPKAGPTGPTCVLTSQFKRQEKVVWRVRVYDPAKSKQLGKAGIKSLFVELPNGKKHKMRYGTHPRKKATDSFWSTAWLIPADYPTGSLSYKVIATDKSGRVHTWQPFNVGNSQFTVIAGNTK